MSMNKKDLKKMRKTVKNSTQEIVDNLALEIRQLSFWGRFKMAWKILWQGRLV